MSWTALFDGVSHSEKLADLPDDTCRLFWFMLLAQADAWGCQDARPRMLGADVWPLLHKAPDETARCVAECAKVGLIALYKDADDTLFLRFPDWEEKAGSVGRKSHRPRSNFFARLNTSSAVAYGEVRPGPPVNARKCPPPPANARNALLSDLILSDPNLLTPPSEEAPSGPAPLFGGEKIPTPEGARKAKLRGGPHAELVEWWRGCWKHYRESEYVPLDKDWVAAAALWKLAPFEEIKKRACRMLEKDETFYLEASDLSLLRSNWNKLAPPPGLNGRH